MAIYVGNLSYNMSEQELSDVFAQYGNISSAKIIKDRYTGRSKGYGFVEFENESDEDKAVEALDGQEVSGRNLKVNKARQREEGEQRPSGGGGGGFRDRGNDRGGDRGGSRGGDRGGDRGDRGDRGGYNRDSY